MHIRCVYIGHWCAIQCYSHYPPSETVAWLSWLRSWLRSPIRLSGVWCKLEVVVFIRGHRPGSWPFGGLWPFLTCLWSMDLEGLIDCPSKMAQDQTKILLICTCSLDFSWGHWCRVYVQLYASPNNICCPSACSVISKSIARQPIVIDVALSTWRPSHP